MNFIGSFTSCLTSLHVLIYHFKRVKIFSVTDMTPKGVYVTFYSWEFSPRKLNQAKIANIKTLSSEQGFLKVWHHQEATACTASVAEPDPEVFSQVERSLLSTAIVPYTMT